MNITDSLSSVAGAFIGDTPHWKPIYEITVDGVLLNPKIDKRLISLNLRDSRGLEADDLDIALDDHDGALQFPPRGAVVTLKLGWAHLGLIDKGTFKVQSVRHSGAPDVLTIKCRAADLGSDWTIKKERSFDKKDYGTLGKILNKIAKEHGAPLKISKHYANEVVEHLDQQNESDLNFVTKLADDYDAIAAVKGGFLLFVTKGAAATAGGTGIPTVIITRTLGDSHDFGVDDADQYTGVTAHWHDKNAGKRKKVTAKKKTKPKPKGSTTSGDVIEGNKENTKVLRHTYATKQSATRAAANEWKRLQRGCADFSYTLARGDVSLICEAPAKIIGIKPFIEERNWLIKEINHNLADGGLTSQMQFESVLLGEFDVIEE